MRRGQSFHPKSVLLVPASSPIWSGGECQSQNWFGVLPFSCPAQMPSNVGCWASVICNLGPKHLTQRIVRLRVHKEFQILLFLKQGKLGIQGRKLKSREQGYTKN